MDDVLLEGEDGEIHIRCDPQTSATALIIPDVTILNDLLEGNRRELEWSRPELHFSHAEEETMCRRTSDGRVYFLARAQKAHSFRTMPIEEDVLALAVSSGAMRFL